MEPEWAPVPQLAYSPIQGVKSREGKGVQRQAVGGSHTNKRQNGEHVQDSVQLWGGQMCAKEGDGLQPERETVRLGPVGGFGREEGGGRDGMGWEQKASH